MVTPISFVSNIEACSGDADRLARLEEHVANQESMIKALQAWHANRQPVLFRRIGLEILVIYIYIALPLARGFFRDCTHTALQYLCHTFSCMCV